jgi:transcriptional regulator with XRE-family HTH domain
MKLSEFLKEKRKSLKLSLRKAAEKIGMSHGYLNKLELGFDERNGKANKPSPDVLRMIATAYKTDFSYLMQLCGYMSAESTDLSQDERQLLT